MRPMKYLKSLSLAAMKVSGQDISYFLKSCPMLRELNITRSSFTFDVHVSGDLEILRIHKCTFRKFVIEISAPHLYEIVADVYEVHSKAKPGALRFRNVPRLAIASLEIGNLRYNAANFASTVSCFTSHLHHLRKLVLFISSKPKILLREELPYMPNLKELYVVVSRVHAHLCLVPVTSIISACPHLQMFTFKFYMYEDDERCPDNYEYKQIYGYEPSRVYGCPHKRLRMLKFQGSCATDIVKLMTYISGRCVEYQKINTCTPDMSEAKVQAHMCHIQQLQLKLPHQVEFKFY
ncbi:uncharacterized protein LOC125190867 [Salvia hispanica]|uniref:uncharacterized protein LOC125190867 n=1 Tax=Salvia hispanica TaxID=49212 RepID=UPI00200941CE|nr:uncharacterized protein LOC125190867 [Salvia hispanica]